MGVNVDMSWTEAKDLFREWRDNNERRSEDVVEIWENVLEDKINKLGSEKFLILEQVVVAALDCNRLGIAGVCINLLFDQFGGSLRILKYSAMKCEAQERYDEAIEILDEIIACDETSNAPRKRKVAILIAQSRIPEAIKELTEYLKRFMADQEAWHELCNLYLMEQDYAKAAFAMEELILYHPHNHLVHQRLADIKYTQGGIENMEIARAYYLQAHKLSASNMRALYGIFLTSNNIANSQKCPAPKKKESIKLMQWAMSKINQKYKDAKNPTGEVVAPSLESMMGSLQV